MAWIHSARYGLEITSDIGAKIGMTVGDDFELLYDSELYENFTVTDDGVTGDLVAFGRATQVLSCRYINDGNPKTIPFPSDWEVLNVSTPVRIAGYVKSDDGGLYNGRKYLDLRFYAEEFGSRTRDTINISIGGSGSYGIKSRQLGSEMLDIAYMQSPGSYGSVALTLDQYIGGNDNYYSRLNNGGYFDWTKKASNIPIFDTLEHCNAYLMDLSDETLEGLLNASQDDPEEKYNNQFKHWYIRSVYGHNTRNSQSGGNVSRNYIFSPKDDGICFLIRNASENSPYTLELKHYSGYTAKTAGRGVYDEDEYVPAPQVATMYLDRSISFGSDNYWTKFEWESNIPRFETEQQCDDYFNGIIDITSASNYAQIARIDNEIIQSDWAGLERDELTSLGTNGMQYGYGLRLYAMTNIELASLFNELFDRANIDDILDGTKLYGSASDCVAGIMYLPLNDLSAICNLGSSAKVWIGSWQADHSEGKRIINNTGLIDCGSFVMTPSYCDFRDFEPYTLLFVMLPFIGFKQLTLSKYLSQSTPKTISVKYAIDVSTGGCCAMILADGKLMDLFEGTCGASRPFSAIDNNGYVNQCISAITGASNSASGSVSGVANAVSDAGKMAAKSGSAMGAVGVGGVAVAGAGTAISGIYQGYQIKQAVDNPPIMQRGNLTGNLSYYTVDKVTFLIAKKRTIRPENELNVIGYPSGHGGTVGQFSGFLKCSAFMMADGFIGSEAERAMILDEMEKGVYI